MLSKYRNEVHSNTKITLCQPNSKTNFYSFKPKVTYPNDFPTIITHIPDEVRLGLKQICGYYILSLSKFWAQ